MSIISRRQLGLIAGGAAAVALTTAAILSSATAASAAAIGEPAPAFTGQSADGSVVSLADYAGKTVVMEWTNRGCPYVKAFYNAGAMQGWQNAYAEDEDVVWLTVVSSAEGKQGHVTAEEALAEVAAQGAAPDHVILDPSGEIGMAYDAKTTPQFVVISPDGALAFNGPAIPKADYRSGAWATETNYLVDAVNAAKAGEAAPQAPEKSYGCGVKYS